MTENVSIATAVLVDESEAGVPAHLAFSMAHWRQLLSKNPLERLNQETDVCGIFLIPEETWRLARAMLAEQHNEWQEDRQSDLALLRTPKRCQPRNRWQPTDEKTAGCGPPQQRELRFRLTRLTGNQQWTTNPGHSLRMGKRSDRLYFATARREE